MTPQPPGKLFHSLPLILRKFKLVRVPERRDRTVILATLSPDCLFHF
jgi:hypothetical protein